MLIVSSSIKLMLDIVSSHVIYLKEKENKIIRTRLNSWKERNVTNHWINSQGCYEKAKELHQGQPSRGL